MELKKHYTNEQTGISYTLHGDFYLPDIKPPETVVLLSQRRPDTHIDIKLDLSELDITAAENKATYQEIKAYVFEKHGLKVIFHRLKPSTVLLSEKTIIRVKRGTECLSVRRKKKMLLWVN